MKRILLLLLVANPVPRLVFKSLVQDLYLLRLLLLLLLLVQRLLDLAERHDGGRCLDALKIGDMRLVMTSFALVTLIYHLRSNPCRCISLHTTTTIRHHRTVSFPLLIDFDS